MPVTGGGAEKEPVGPGDHPGERQGRAGWDEMLGTLPRLKVAAYLSGCGQAEFGVVAVATELSPPTLSKAAVSLERAGYLKVRKGHVGRRPRTWLALTERGRAAFQAHMNAVRSLAEAGKHSRADSAAGRGPAERGRWPRHEPSRPPGQQRGSR